MSPDTLSVALRALSFVALLQAVGIAIFMRLFEPILVLAQRDIRRLGIGSVAIALPLLVGQYVLEPARMAGEFAGVLDLSLQQVALESSTAVTLGVRVIGLVLVWAALSRAIRGARMSGLAGALLIAVSFALMGHTAVHAGRPLLAAALVTHVLIAAFWFGAIPSLYLLTRREAAELAGRAVEAFSRIAIWLVPALAIAGASMALVLVRHLSVFREPYGWLLLVKSMGFVLLIGFAAANRLRLGPAVAHGATRSFTRSLAAEYVLLVAVLAATAVMTTLYSPEA